MPKARKLTRAELQERSDRLDRENFILVRALQSAINDTVDWYATAQQPNVEPSELYHFGLVDRDAAHGGILLVRFSKEGQDEHTATYYLEDKLREIEKLQHSNPSNYWYQLASSPIRQAHYMALEAYKEKRK